jgi:hypothetical protein
VSQAQLFSSQIEDRGAVSQDEMMDCYQFGKVPMAKFLAYIDVNGRVTMQIWHGDQKTGAGQFKRGAVGTVDFLDFFSLRDGDEELDLNALAKKYPYVGPLYYSTHFNTTRRHTVTKGE